MQSTTRLELAAETALQTYADQDYNLTWAATEATQLLHRIRVLFRDQEKERLALAIKQAQVMGDQTKIKELFEKLNRLV